MMTKDREERKLSSRKKNNDLEEYLNSEKFK